MSLLGDERLRFFEPVLFVRERASKVSPETAASRQPLRVQQVEPPRRHLLRAMLEILVHALGGPQGEETLVELVAHADRASVRVGPAAGGIGRDEQVTVVRLEGVRVVDP